MPWIACQGAARNVQLREPHHILSAGTLVLGADVTHDVAGVSVAAIVASRDELFANYFADLRGQSPFVFSPPIHEHSWKPLLDCCLFDAFADLGQRISDMPQAWDDSNVAVSQDQS